MGQEPNNERGKHADTVIRNHIIWAMGAGFIPVLIADIFAVSALQLDMIRQLCRVYDVNFQETQGKAIVTSLTSSTLARVGAGSLVKLIPGVGSMLGGVTVSVFAGASTFALGEVFKRHFESGGTILDFDPGRLKKLYKEKFEKGKKVAEQLRKKTKQEAESVSEDIAHFAEEAGETAAEAAEEILGKQRSGKESVVDRLKDLAELRDNGIITEEDFQTMKKKLIDNF